MDPITIGLTALSFIFGRDREPSTPVEGLVIDAEGRAAFEYDTGAGKGVAQPGRPLREMLDLMAERITAHIRQGAPLPDQYYSGRQTNPYIRSIYREIRDAAAAAREDFLAISEPGPDEDFPEYFEPFGEPYTPVRGGEQITPVGPEDFFVPRFVRRFHTSVPGGLAGFSQQTAVGQMQLTGRAPTRRIPGPKRRARPVKASAARRRVNGRRGKPRPGTKAWMTYIRGLRKKR